MSTILHQKSEEGRGKVLARGAVPIALHFAPGQPTVTQFVAGEEALSSCLRCHDAPCMMLSERELSALNVAGFPADRTNEVCAAGAMSRPGKIGAPVIDPATCVLCGVCAVRCPVGAIHLVPGEGARVNDAANDLFVETADNPEERMLEQRNLFTRAVPSGVLLTESDAIIDDVHVRLMRAWSALGDRLPNLLARSLLNAVGVGALMRRRGDNAMRMDLILGGPGVSQGVAEVEFGDDAVLDSPRDILDDIAVVVGRYGWDKTQVTALIVAFVLPNRRSEYWRILHDIRQVFGLSVSTVTVVALILLVWERKTITLPPANAFYADETTSSYRTDVVEKVLGRRLDLNTERRPYVEVAK